MDAKEVFYAVETFLVELQCPICKNGTLEPDNMQFMLTTNPPQVYHKCTNTDCTYYGYFTKVYPHTVQRKISNHPVCL